MARFHFISLWVIDAPIHAVFDALHDYERWPEWWPGAEQMEELEPTDASGLGGRARYEWRSDLGYRLRFEGTVTGLERPHLLAGSVDGDLTGTGTWRLFEQPGGLTAAVYEWHVELRRWPPVLAWILRPVLVRSHDRLMRDGARGLAQRLDAPLILHR